MITKINSLFRTGFECEVVSIEIHSKKGIPSWNFVGLAGRAIRESKERVISSLMEIGVDPRGYRWTINFTPAFKNKDGSGFDLPLALGVLNQINPLNLPFSLDDALIAGELSLDGYIKPIPDLLNFIKFFKSSHYKTLIIPLSQLEGLTSIPGKKLFGITHISELTTSSLQEFDKLPANQPTFDAHEIWESSEIIQKTRWKDFQDNLLMKETLLLCLLFNKSLFLSGNPGVGKTHFVRLIHELKPQLTDSQWLELARIHELNSSMLATNQRKPPFYTAQVNTTVAGFLGGGVSFKPGILSLAQHGILFVDEALEYKPYFFEFLRQALELNYIDFYRSQTQIRIPAQTQVVFATNLCPCGSAYESSCNCKDNEITQYRNKISRAFLERIDIHLHIDQPTLQKSHDSFEYFVKFHKELEFLRVKLETTPLQLKKLEDEEEVLSHREILKRRELISALDFITHSTLNLHQLRLKVRFFRHFYLDF